MSMSSSFCSETSELCQLKDENKLLREENVQCKADKEFVWSLWQRLQVSNPDVTHAIALVVERKKEEADAKEKRLINVISEKDLKIQRLDQQVSALNQEISSQLEMKLDLQNILEQRQLELKDCLSKLASLQKELKDLELRDVESASREVVRELDGLNLELKQLLNARDAELAQVQLRNSELIKADIGQREKLSDLEDLVRSLGDRNASLNNDLSVLQNRCKKFESEVRRLRKVRENKDAEMETLRKELSETWQALRKESESAGQQTNLNHQLQLLLQDTQKMVESQEEAFTIEITAQKQAILEQGLTIDSLRDRLQSAEAELARAEGERQARTSAGSQPGIVVDESLNGDDCQRNEALWQQKAEIAERKIADLRELLVKKNNELGALRTAHSRRLERLRSVLTSNRLMKKQLRLFHEDPVGVATKKPRTLNSGSQAKSVEKSHQSKSRPKALREEDSDSVWNELNLLKKENKVLKAENVHLAEEADMLRIESANSATTIHELKCCLEQQQQEINLREDEREKYRVSSERLHEEASINKSRLDKALYDVADLQKEGSHLRTDLEITEEENRTLVAELDFLRQNDVQQTMRIAHLEKDLLRLQRKLRKRFVQLKTVKTQTSKQRYRSKPNRHFLTRAIEIEDRDEWQDASESECDRCLVSDDPAASVMSQSTMTDESLGRVIGQRLHSNILEASNDVVQNETLEKSNRGPARKENKPVLTNRQRQAIKQYMLSMTKGLMHPRRTDSVEGSGADEKEEAGVGSLPAVIGSHPRNISASKKASSLKKRIASLQRQVSVLKTAKDSVLSASERQKRELGSLQEQLNIANQRLLSGKLLTQRLSSEVDRLKAEKETIETKMSEYTFESGSCSARPDQEWISLQHRFKAASSALSKQLETLKQLRSENRKQQEKILLLTQRNDRLEQDLNNKRMLIEDYKLKLAVAEQNDDADADINMMLEVESKLKSLAEENYRLKTKVECLSKRISVVSKEKLDVHATVKKLSEEIDRKSKIVMDLQRKNAELQSSVSATERSASSHLQRLASQTEAAVDVAQSRLACAEGRLQECNSFVKMLAHALLEGLRQSRWLLSTQKADLRKREERSSAIAESPLLLVQQRACEILNITETDFTDIMSVSSRCAADEDSLSVKMMSKDDAKWAKKCESVLQSETRFAAKLVELFIEKLEERCRLASQLSAL